MIKKGIFIVISVIGITLILSVLQYGIHYYHNPVEEEINFNAIGYILFNPDGTEREKVDVEVRGKRLHYIFKNRPEAAQGDILIDGYSIFGNIDDRDIGFYTEFRGESFSCTGIGGDDTLCEIISLSKDFQSIVCGINIAPPIVDDGKMRWSGQAILIIPGNDLESAKEMIKNVSLNSQQMHDWLIKNGWEM